MRGFTYVLRISPSGDLTVNVRSSVIQMGDVGRSACCYARGPTARVIPGFGFITTPLLLPKVRGVAPANASGIEGDLGVM